jgi:anti-sigma factor RsiW
MRRPTEDRPGAVRTCKDVIALLTEYMEGSLAPTLARRLEDHLANCPACEGFLENLKATRAAVRNLRCDEIPEDCHRRLRAFLDRKLRSGRV